MAAIRRLANTSIRDALRGSAKRVFSRNPVEFLRPARTNGFELRVSGVLGAEAPKRAARAVGNDTAVANGAGPAPGKLPPSAVPALRARIPHATVRSVRSAPRVETRGYN